MYNCCHNLQFYSIIYYYLDSIITGNEITLLNYIIIIIKLFLL